MKLHNKLKSIFKKEIVISSVVIAMISIFSAISIGQISMDCHIERDPKSGDIVVCSDKVIVVGKPPPPRFEFPPTMPPPPGGLPPVPPICRAVASMAANDPNVFTSSLEAAILSSSIVLRDYPNCAKFLSSSYEDKTVSLGIYLNELGGSDFDIVEHFNQIPYSELDSRAQDVLSGQQFQLVHTFTAFPGNYCNNSDSRVPPSDALSIEGQPSIPIVILPTFHALSPNEKVRVVLHEIGHMTQDGRHFDNSSELAYNRMIRALCGL